MRFNIQYNDRHKYHKLWVSDNGFYGIGVVSHGLDEFSVSFLVREKVGANWIPLKHYDRGDWSNTTRHIVDIITGLDSFTSVNPLFKNDAGDHEFILIENLI